MDDLARDVALAQDAIRDAETALENLTDIDPERAFVVYRMLSDVLTTGRDINKRLASKIGYAIKDLPAPVILAGKTVKPHPDVARSKWDSEELLRLVKDSRIVDAETGEVKDETELDRIKDVYPLKGYNARIGKLRDRGIDPDEFCSSEFRGWTLEVR